MSLVKDILSGDLPEVPITVRIEDRSILKIGVAAVMVATIIILLAAVVKHKK